jgi:hypothetical protein
LSKTGDSGKVKYYIKWNDFETQQLSKRGSSLKTLKKELEKTPNTPQFQEFFVRYKKLYAIITALESLLPNFNSLKKENQDQQINSLNRRQFKDKYTELYEAPLPQGLLGSLVSGVSSFFTPAQPNPVESEVVQILREQSQTSGGGPSEEVEVVEETAPLRPSIGGLRQRSSGGNSSSGGGNQYSGEGTESVVGANLRSLDSSSFVPGPSTLASAAVGPQRTAYRQKPLPVGNSSYTLFVSPTPQPPTPQPQRQFSLQPPQPDNRPPLPISSFVPFNVKQGLPTPPSAPPPLPAPVLFSAPQSLPKYFGSSLPQQGATILPPPSSGGEARSSTTQQPPQQVRAPQQVQQVQQVQQQQQVAPQAQVLLAQGAHAHSTNAEINRKIAVIEAIVPRLLNLGQAELTEAELILFKSELQDVYDADGGQTLKKYAMTHYGPGNENFFLSVSLSDPRFVYFPSALTQHQVASARAGGNHVPDLQYLNRVSEFSQI